MHLSLVDLAFKYEGRVKDVPIVTSISDKYRNSQDYLSEFSKEKLFVKEILKLKKLNYLKNLKIGILQITAEIIYQMVKKLLNIAIRCLVNHLKVNG